MPQLKKFAKIHNLKIISVADLIRYRTAHERFITCQSTVQLPTDYGMFTMKTYEDAISKVTHVVLMKGEISETEPTLTRVHSECFTGDILGSLRCDCGPQLHTALEMIEAEGFGVLIYLRQEGRGIGL